MDLKVVIKQMLDSGLSREQVIDNLKELGVSDAERLFDEASGVKTTVVKEKAPEPKPVAVKEKPVSFPSSGRSLFGSQPAREKPAVKTYPPSEKEVSLSSFDEKQQGLFSEEKPVKEKEEKIEFETLNKEEEEPEEDDSLNQLERTLAEKQATFDVGEPASLEEKLDATLALLKALQSINAKILDTDRRILLRLKDA